MQNLAALAAAASATQATPTGSSALTTSSSPLSVLTSSGTSTGQQAHSSWDAYKGWSRFLSLTPPHLYVPFNLIPLTCLCKHCWVFLINLSSYCLPIPSLCFMFPGL